MKEVFSFTYLHLEKGIPIHQAHSYCDCDEQKPCQDCARMTYTEKQQDLTISLLSLCFSLVRASNSTCNRWVAPSGAMIRNGDNDTPVQSQLHAMRTAVCRDPTGGEIPVALVRCQPFDDFPEAGVSRTNRLFFQNGPVN